MGQVFGMRWFSTSLSRVLWTESIDDLAWLAWQGRWKSKHQGPGMDRPRGQWYKGGEAGQGCMKLEGLIPTSKMPCPSRAAASAQKMPQTLSIPQQSTSDCVRQGGCCLRTGGDGLSLFRTPSFIGSQWPASTPMRIHREQNRSPLLKGWMSKE